MAASAWGAAAGMIPDLWASWMATYLLHSTLLLGAVWGVAICGVGSEALRDLLWKVALLAGLLSASAQVSGLSAPSFALPLPEGGWASSLTVAPAAGGPARAPGLAADGPRPVPGAVAAAPERGAETTPRSAWLPLLLLWCLAVAVQLIRLGALRVRLRWELRSRREITSGALRTMLDGLCAATAAGPTVRLTVSPMVRSPVALGRAEICVPPRAVDSLGRAEQQAMLAHELAHLRRGDPLWMAGLLLLEALLFVQPFNRIGRRAWQDNAEFLCDRWALRYAPGIDLARCIAEIAGWKTPGRVLPGTAGIASPGPLTRRVERLLAVEGSGELGPAHRLALVAALVALTVVSAPGLPGPRPPRAQSGASGSPVAPAGGAVEREVAGGETLPGAGALLPLSAGTSRTYGSGPSDVRVVLWSYGPLWQPSHQLRGKIRFSTRGRITFSSDAGTIRAITPGGSLVVEETEPGGTRRRLEVRPREEGRLTYAYSEEGAPVSWGSSRVGRLWSRELLRELVRTGGEPSGGSAPRAEPQR